ncbi:MAG: ribonuclease R [Candidatus Delongbacteria bacterium]|nr:ribonuclease R [Candidatus Delongbacteria bacterium]MBN2837093.1 ribonuclease R [Candidatus Delongbacteria bacterium]
MNKKPRHKRRPDNKKSQKSSIAPIKAPKKEGSKSSKGRRTFTGFCEVIKNKNVRVHCDQFDHHVFVHSKNNPGVGDGDIVEFFLTNSVGDLEGKIVKILRRVQVEFVGIVELRMEKLYVKTDNDLLVYVPNELSLDAKPDMMVLVRVDNFDRKTSGEIIEVLGEKNAPHVSMMVIARKHGFKEVFPKEALDELTGITPDFIEVNGQERVDLRSKKLFTVDPTDAKDFDDAITISRKSDGYELGVHIADVSAFVTEGSNLDKEAFERGFSLYLPSSVIPMLPPLLSNHYCSLNPNTDRLAFSCLMELNDKGEVKKYSFRETIVHSTKRFDYKTFQKSLENIENGEKAVEGFEDFSEEILLSAELKRKLKANRIANGSIEFELPETKIELDKDGKVTAIYPYQTFEANQIIEEFMLIANKCAADFMLNRENKMSGVYRIHEEPSTEKLEGFLEELKKNGIKFSKPKNIIDYRFMQSVIEKVKAHPNGDVLSYNFLRSMRKAKYSVDNLGHYGLAFDRYTHFTSPIRRYADLMVHRIIKKHLRTLAVRKNDDRLKIVDNKCKFVSLREIKSIKAEYEAKDLKIAEFMAEKKGQTFDGVIAGISPHGFYVRLREIPVEGLVHVKNLKDDHYNYFEDKRLLKGRKYGKEYFSGIDVKVILESVNLELMTIDFDLVKEKKETASAE